MPFITSVERIGTEKGIQIGILKGRQETLVNILRRHIFWERDQWNAGSR